MKKLLVNILKGLLLAWYKLCCLFPTKDRIVALSRQQDTEPLDFKLVREYLEESGSGYQWVSLPKTLGANKVGYAFHMLTQLRLIATSRAVVLDSYAIVVSLLAGHIKVPVVQMWHAMGNMKKFGYTCLGSSGEARSEESAQLLNMHKGYTSILISSMDFVEDYAAGFGCDPSIIYEAPLPKTDLLLSEANRRACREAALAAYPQLEGKETIVYAPTFRRVASSNQEQAMAALIDAVDFNRYNLVFQPHPVSTQHISDPRVIENRDRNINMLYAADCVISDYSTVIYEAGLLGLPVYLYAYDWKEYQGKRSLNIDIKRDVPTLFTGDASQIVQAIENSEFDGDAYAAFIQRNVSVPAQGTCTQRVAEHILGLI